MIDFIESAATSVGITTFITNSTEKIETQLNRLTRLEDLPIMLISWDYDVTLAFNVNGFLDNPTANIVCLLMDKAEDTSKIEAEETSKRMGSLYKKFIIKLDELLTPITLRADRGTVWGITYKHVPKHGAGVHSGVLGRFTMIDRVVNC